MTRNVKNETRGKWQNRYDKVKIRKLDSYHKCLWKCWTSSYGFKDEWIRFSSSLNLILTSMITYSKIIQPDRNHMMSPIPKKTRKSWIRYDILIDQRIVYGRISLHSFTEWEIWIHHSESLKRIWMKKKTTTLITITKNHFFQINTWKESLFIEKNHHITLISYVKRDVIAYANVSSCAYVSSYERYRSHSIHTQSYISFSKTILYLTSKSWLCLYFADLTPSLIFRSIWSNRVVNERHFRLSIVSLSPYMNVRFCATKLLQIHLHPSQ